PYFHPDGKRIIFASNMNDPNGRNFDLYIIDADGKNQEQITFNPTFDAFPMFSPDGKQLVFASNRNGSKPHETNIFIADWVDQPVSAQQLRKHVEYLASDAMKGRLTGTPEARKAAEYIAGQLKKDGLQPTYQQFQFISGVKLAAGNSLVFGDRKYKVSEDFIPTGFSEDANLRTIPVVFAGYGIKASDQQWDDYSGLDVKGKAVVVYRFGPEGD